MRMIYINLIYYGHTAFRVIRDTAQKIASMRYQFYIFYGDGMCSFEFKCIDTPVIDSLTKKNE